MIDSIFIDHTHLFHEDMSSAVFLFKGRISYWSSMFSMNLVHKPTQGDIINTQSHVGGKVVYIHLLWEWDFHPSPPILKEFLFTFNLTRGFVLSSLKQKKSCVHTTFRRHHLIGVCWIYRLQDLSASSFLTFFNSLWNSVLIHTCI